MLHRFAGTAVFLYCRAEQLDRLDIGIRVDKPSGNTGIGVRRVLCRQPDARNEEEGGDGETHEPDGNDGSKPQIELCDQNQCRDRIDDDEPGNLQQVDHEIAGGQARLQHFLCKPPGEIVLEITQALLHDPLMALPSDQVEETRNHGLLLDKRHQRVDDQPQDKDNERHPGQRPGVIGEETLPVARLEKINDPSEKIEDRAFHERRQPAERKHGNERPADLHHEIGQEGDPAPGHILLRGNAKRIDPCFKQTKEWRHGPSPGTGAILNTHSTRAGCYRANK